MDAIFEKINAAVANPHSYDANAKLAIESQINIFMATFIAGLTQAEFEKIKKDKIIVPTNG